MNQAVIDIGSNSVRLTLYRIDGQSFKIIFREKIMADLMTRNLNRRVEIACPVYDSQLREHLKWMLNSQLNDSSKASLMLSDGCYSRKHSADPFDSQAYFMTQSPHIPVPAVVVKEKLTKRIVRFLHKVLKHFFTTPPSDI